MEEKDSKRNWARGDNDFLIESCSRKSWEIGYLAKYCFEYECNR